MLKKSNSHHVLKRYKSKQSVSVESEIIHVDVVVIEVVLVAVNGFQYYVLACYFLLKLHNPV